MKKQSLRRVAAAFLVFCLGGLSGCSALSGGSQAQTSVQVIPVPSQPSSAAQQPQGEAPQNSQSNTALPEGFAYVADVCEVLQDIRYYSSYNFVGARINGYEAPVAILTTQAAQALAGVAQQLKQQGYILKIFDSYRPTSAVEHFASWAKNPEDTAMKPYFYPDVDKSQLFNKGYLATKSGHSRGSTVDLTLVDMQTGHELDMGTGFDFFGPASHFGSGLVTTQQAANRQLLRSAMQGGGFVPYQNEWWHFTLENEPYPDTYFEFAVR